MRNHGLSFHELPEGVQSAFLGTPEKRPLPAGFQLYKFTERSPFDGPAGGFVSPWWSSVEPLGPSDPGFEGMLRRATASRSDPEEYARARAAVKLDWNDMSMLVRIRLLLPAFGFVGRCRHQRLSDEIDAASGRLRHENVYLIGGAWQIYLPNLTTSDVAADHLAG